MKKTLVLLVALAFLSALSLRAQTTSIWIVRHAEKDATNPQNPDPDLSPSGLQRAKDLAVYLAKSKPAAIYSTNYKRTIQTAGPLSRQSGVKIATYDPGQMALLKETVLSQYAGKELVIVGHSNTVLELVEAFGGKRPVAALSDEDYDYVFKVSITKDGKVQAETFQYGAKHRNSKGAAMN